MTNSKIETNTPKNTDVPEVLAAWRQDWPTLTWRNQRVLWWQESRQRRAARKRERTTHDRKFFGAELWGVSRLHRDMATRESELTKRGLPVLRSELELAKWLGITLPRLRWYTHDKPMDTVWHYVRYAIPKRSGGQRVILAPKTQLKALQHKILRGIVEKIQPSQAAHGFIKDRSIITNARPHVHKKFILNLDLKDFFPSVTYPRIRGLFLSWGYCFSVASTLALLCTEHDRQLFERAKEKYWISVGPRALVQGAPTSPALANLIAWKLDKRLTGFANKYQLTFTRYADDLTFSSDEQRSVLLALHRVPQIIAAEGFQMNGRKIRILRRSGQQSVTGIVVNDKVNIPRKVRRQLRAILHNAGKTGLAAQNRDQREDFRAYLQGMIGFLNEANPQEAAHLREQLKTL